MQHTQVRHRLQSAGWDPLHADELTRAIEAAPPGSFATFDADGTLWAGDVGEALMLALLDEGRLGALPAGDRTAWDRYLAMQETDHTAAYAWVVELLEGWREEELVARCEALADLFVPDQAFTPMVALAQELETAGVSVWFVSASNRWMVDAGVRRLGLPGGRVLGMQVAVESGVLSGRILPPRTNLEGKCEAIRAAIGPSPRLAAGNSVNDAPMLRMATGLALVVNPSESLYGEAVREGWLVKVF
ncbi:MAG: hypothetical protein AMXMBFR64_59460 [Myxococcales bacterium]